MRKGIFSFIAILMMHVAVSQTREIARCGNEYDEQSAEPSSALQNFRTTSTNGTVYRIPVVFHVLTDQPTGVSNISDCIIQNQIQILNNCFRRKAGAPNTNVAGADAEIEFYLARKNPTGGATNGINRVTTTNCNYTTLNSSTQLSAIRSAAKWPVDKYLNIWVLKTMPNSNRVRGQAFVGGSSSIGSQNIGVLVHYSYIGSKNSGCPNLSYLDATNFKAYDLGMTVVHEVGHYLNLLHTFDNCTPGDGCDDTPKVSGVPNAFCNSDNDKKGICSGETKNRMWQNYLDYSDDACMDRFTSCQVTRMRNQLTGIAFYKNLITSANFLATGGDIATSVNELGKLNQDGIKIFPNPFTKSIQLVAAGTNNINRPFRILNLYGQEILRGKVQSNVQIVSLDQLSEGNYFFEYGNRSYKIIKQ